MSEIKRKTHILIECPDLIASVRVGVIEPLQYFVKNNLCDIQFKKTLDITAQDLAWCDTLICVRGYEPQTLEIVKIAKQYKRKIIYFLDDDLLALPKDIASASSVLNKMIEEYLPMILSMADKLMVVNKLIGEKYSKLYGVEYFISAVPVVLKKVRSERQLLNDKINILYAGSIDHTAQVRSLLVPALKKIISKHNQVMVTFIGTDPGETNKKFKFYSYFDNYDEYKRIVEDGNFQIGLAPIEETEFYRSKYYNKYCEYTSIGAVGVYTDSEPYTLVIENKKNGMLCKNDVNSWYDAISFLINNLDERNKMLICAETNLQNEYGYESVAKNIQNEMPWLMTYIIEKDDYPAIKRDFIRYNACYYYLNKALICWEEDGIKCIPFLIRKSIKILALKLNGGI